METATTDTPEPKRPQRFRVARLCLVGALAAVLLVASGIALFLWSLHRSENSDFLRQQLLSALETGLGPAHDLKLDRAQLQLSGVTPVFSIGGLDIRQTENGGRATLERADFKLFTGSLWSFSPQAQAVAFEGLRIVLPASEGDPARAIADAKAALHATISVTHALFAIASREAVLREITGRKIELFKREADGRETLVQSGLEVALNRDDKRVTLAISREGRAEKLSLEATGLSEGEGKPIVLKAQPISVQALSALIGLAVPGVSPEFQVAVEGLIEGRATRVSITAGKGVIDRPELGLMALPVDEARLDLAVPEPGQGIEVTRLFFRSGDARVEASGLIKANAEGALDVALKASEAQPGRLTPSEEIVQLTRLDLDAEVSRDGRTFTLRALNFGDGTAQGRLEGVFSSAGEGKIETRLDAAGFAGRRALRLWPVTIAPELRDWLIKHIEGGTLTSVSLHSRLEGQTLRDALALKPIPDEALRVEYRLDDLIMRPIFDAPPVRKASVKGQSSGRKSSLTLESGEVEIRPGRSILLKNAEFSIPDLAKHPAVLNLRLPFSGRLDSIIAYLATPTLKRVANPPTELALQEGQAEGVATGWVRLVDKPGANDAKIDATAEFKGVRIDPVVKGEKLESGNFQFSSRAGVVTIKGDGRINGTPAQIEWRVEPGQDPNGSVKMVLDDATRAKRGFDLKNVVTGPVAATISINLPPNAPADVDVELDLTRAKIEGIAPGFVKRPGLAAKVSFDHAIRGDRQVLNEFDLDLGGIAARGRIELQADGQFIKADLASLKLSPGDNVRGSIEKIRNGVKIMLRGNAFDLRPFLRGFQSGRIDDGKGADLDLDLQTTVLIGFNSEILAGADVQAQRRSGNMTRLKVRGRYGSEPLVVDTVEQQGDTLSLAINTGDGGALVRFMDLYPRAFGGRMIADIAVGPQGQRGQVQAWDFAIRGESFLRQYAGGSAVAGGPMSQSSGNTRRSEDVVFQKLRASFVRRTGRIDFSEAVMWGPAVGGNIEGYLDYAGDRVDIKGALVPAYALNNLFAQLPLIGPIIGGSQYEGLFALPFVITGRASQPLLRTNALSVIAPGFLRKMFELQREDGPDGRRNRSAPARNNPQQ